MSEECRTMQELVPEAKDLGSKSWEKFHKGKKLLYTMASGSGSFSPPSRSGRHVRNASEPLYSRQSELDVTDISQTLSTDETSSFNNSGARHEHYPSAPSFSSFNRPRLSTLERQWSTSNVVASGDGYISPFLQPEESPWASTFGSAAQAGIGRNARATPTTTRPGRSVSLPVANELSMIHDAARITNWPSVLMLCQSHPQHARYKNPADGWTALHHACNRRCPRVDVVEALVQAYPDALLLEEEKGMTPLHYACRFKAPADVVRVLLHMFPSLGHAAVSKRDRKGRTPLFYAVRYDAPPGVVEMLLEIDPSAVLEEDRSAESPLAVVWDAWAEKFEGKRTLQPFLLNEDETVDLMQQLKENSKLAEKWDTVNLFLRAAFGFPRTEDVKRTAIETGRTWRVLHACCAIKCHPTLFRLSLSLFPEQASQLDQHDLYPDVSRQTALHLAAASPAYGETARVILKSLLNAFPEAAQIPDSKDGSLPLHRVVENERKSHWTLEGAKDVFEAFPLAARMPDQHGRLPLHRAAAAHHPSHHHMATEDDENQSDSEDEDDESSSVICNLVNAYPEAAARADNAGRLAMHVIAEHGEAWDDEADAIYQANQGAVRVRAGPELHNRLPIHLAAASPDARRSLVERLVELHPLGVTQPDRTGKLPLHLACESGKMWDKGVSAIYNAFPNAIRQPEGNSRRWYALTMAATSANASSALISRLAELYPDAASEMDGERRYPLHWVCDSGKRWDGGVEAIFQANPEALLEEDRLGLLPFHVAALRYSRSVPSSSNQAEEGHAVFPVPLQVSRGASISERTGTEDDAPKVEVLFQLLRAEPSILGFL